MLPVGFAAVNSEVFGARLGIDGIKGMAGLGPRPKALRTPGIRPWLVGVGAGATKLDGTIVNGLSPSKDII